MRLVAGFGAGIDVMLLAGWLAERGAEQQAVAWVGLAGAALAVGSLTATVRGR